MNSPTITTNICTYRRPQLLRRAIESVLNQTYQDFLICIYDNNSEDDTADVAAEFVKRDSRIKYHCHPENIGATRNYLYAMKYIQTPFFSFLADDDLILPTFYSVALAGFEKEPSAIFSATSFLCLSMQGNKVGGGNFPSKVLYPPDGVFEFVESHIDPKIHGTLIRKEALPDLELINHGWDDRGFLYRVAAVSPVVISAEECFIFTTHNMDKGGGFKIDIAWLERESIGDSLRPLMSKQSFNKLESIFDKEIQSALYLLSIELIYKNDFVGARIGANKLWNKYGLYIQSFTLEILVLTFKLFPFILNFLRSVRDLRPYIKGQKEEFPMLTYAEIMHIYKNKKYL